MLGFHCPHRSLTLALHTCSHTTQAYRHTVHTHNSTPTASHTLTPAETLVLCLPYTVHTHTKPPLHTGLLVLGHPPTPTPGRGCSSVPRQVTGEPGASPGSAQLCPQGRPDLGTHRDSTASVMGHDPREDLGSEHWGQSRLGTPGWGTRGSAVARSGKLRQGLDRVPGTPGSQGAGLGEDKVPGQGAVLVGQGQPGRATLGTAPRSRGHRHRTEADPPHRQQLGPGPEDQAVGRAGLDPQGGQGVPLHTKSSRPHQTAVPK